MLLLSLTKLVITDAAYAALSTAGILLESDSCIARGTQLPLSEA